MWYEDLRPFGATEREIFYFVEHLFAQKNIPEPGSEWLAEGQPFAALLHALFWCCEGRPGVVAGDVKKAVALAPRSPLTRVVAGFALTLTGQFEAARAHLVFLEKWMTPAAEVDAQRVLAGLQVEDPRFVSPDGQWARELREELLVKLGRAAGLVVPHYEVEREDRRANLKFLFLLAKFGGDLKEAVGIGERLVGMSQGNPGVAREVQAMEREIAVVRAQKLREEVEQAKRAAQLEETALREQMEEARAGMRAVQLEETALREQMEEAKAGVRALAQEVQEQAGKVKDGLHDQARKLREDADGQTSAEEEISNRAPESPTPFEKYEAALKDLLPFLKGEPEDGEIHRTYLVIKAEIASFEQDWAGLEQLAEEGNSRWPDQSLWGEYFRTAEIQQLFDAYQGYEHDGDDRNAWNTLEVLLGLDPDNPDFQDRAANFRHVIPGGRELEIRALFAPHEAGTRVEDGEYINIEVGEFWIKAHVVEADGTRAFLILEHPSKSTERSTPVPSFAMRLIGTEGQSSAGKTIRALARAVVQNAPDDFPWVAASFSDS